MMLWNWIKRENENKNDEQIKFLRKLESLGFPSC